MTDKRRRIIAFIAGKLKTKKNSSTIFDYRTSEHTGLYVNFSGNSISIYDYGRNCYVIAQKNAKDVSIYDYGAGCYINLKLLDKNKFEGYDYGSNAHFNGDVNNGNISFYDEEKSETFNYLI